MAEESPFIFCNDTGYISCISELVLSINVFI
jgi:hypothetical protein